MKGCRLKSKETEIVKHSKPKGEETEREFETVRHKLGLELYCGIKAIKIGLQNGDKAKNYFHFFSILKFRKIILKLQEKFKEKKW